MKVHNTPIDYVKNINYNCRKIDLFRITSNKINKITENKLSQRAHVE